MHTTTNIYYNASYRAYRLYVITSKNTMFLLFFNKFTAEPEIYINLNNTCIKHNWQFLLVCLVVYILRQKVEKVCNYYGCNALNPRA